MIELFSLTYLPAISVIAIVSRTPDSSNEAIMAALEMHGPSKCVHISRSVCTVATVITNRAISTPKIMDAILFAVSVVTAPVPQRFVYKQREKNYV